MAVDPSQVYGMQPRWKKYAKRALQRSPDAKFDEVVEKLAELTQQAWSLQTNTNTASSRCISSLDERLVLSHGVQQPPHSCLLGPWSCMGQTWSVPQCRECTPNGYNVLQSCIGH